MPGIAGIISRQPAAHCEAAVKTMVATLRHERFHAGGTFFAPELGVWAGWVADESSLAAGQVFQNEQKNIALVFAGECFVPAETKNWLRQKGHDVTAGGGCLVHLYEELGENFFAELNGLFSGLLIDRRQGKAFLFNDRYPMERVYWHETADAFYFASEAKALLRILPELRVFDSAGVAEYLALGSTLGERTLFRGIQRLPGGSRWVFENGAVRRAVYFSPSAWEALPKLPPEDYEAKLRATFLKVIPQYFDSDLKLGIALTGGLDTRMFMACLPAGPKPVTYTFTGPTGRTADDRIAARVAAACGLEHRLLRLHADFFSGFASHADKNVYITDGTYGIAGTHEIYFHREARQSAPLRLTGNYGGEIFRGVSTFKPLRLVARMFDPGMGPQIEAATAGFSAWRAGSPDSFAAFKEMPGNLYGNLSAGRSQINFRTPYLDNELVALAYQCPASLKKTALPTMRFIQARTPGLAAIPTDRGFDGRNSGVAFAVRRVFAEVTCKMDYHSLAGLPRKLAWFNPVYKPVMNALGITGSHKFLRYGSWFRHELAGYVREVFADARVRDNGIWRPEFLDQMLARHLGGRDDYSAEISAVLSLAAIERRLLRGWPAETGS